MKKWAFAAASGVIAVGVLFAACGGGGDDDDNGDKTASASKTVARTASGTGTARAGTTGTPGTPGAEGTTGAQTTPGAGNTAQAGGSPGPNATPAPGETAATGGTTPQANATVDPENPFVTSAPTPTTGEVGAIAEADESLVGGDPNAPPEVVTDLPDPPSGATIDPATIADPGAVSGGLRLVIDTNASEPGIQASRSVRVGDVFRVGIVLGNAESLGAFNFYLNYDYTKAVAPTINNGSSLSRNPDLNEDGLGGTAAQWICMPPAPEGDADEPGLFTGDGDPSTGQAAASCYTTSVGPSGASLVMAVVQFQAIAAGTFEMSFEPGGEFTAVFDSVFTQLLNCTGGECGTASITVQ